MVRFIHIFFNVLICIALCQDLRYHAIRFELKLSTNSEHIFQLQNTKIYKGKLHTSKSQNHIIYPEVLDYYLFTKNYTIPLYGSGLLDVPDGVAVSFNIFFKKNPIANVYINMTSVTGPVEFYVNNIGSFNCSVMNSTVKSFLQANILC